MEKIRIRDGKKLGPGKTSRIRNTGMNEQHLNLNCCAGGGEQRGRGPHSERDGDTAGASGPHAPRTRRRCCQGPLRPSQFIMLF
jgi:hypothetical protein